MNARIIRRIVNKKWICYPQVLIGDSYLPIMWRRGELTVSKLTSIKCSFENKRDAMKLLKEYEYQLDKYGVQQGDKCIIIKSI